MSAPILLVDDDANVLKALQRMLRREGFEVDTCPSAAQALLQLGERRYAVIVSDQCMPEKTGVELLREASQLHPDARRVLLTGFIDAQMAALAINRGQVFKLLFKPWSNEELVDALREAIWDFELQTEDASGMDDGLQSDPADRSGLDG